MAASGIAMFGGAKLDELTSGKEGSKNISNSRKGGDMKNSDAFQRAMHNVGRPPAGYGNAQYGSPRTGAAYKKNAAYARNMNDAENSMKNSAKKRHGMGIMSAKLFSAMVGGMNTSINDFDDLKSIGRGFKEAFSDKDFEGKDSNYPYSKQYFLDMRKAALGKLETSWDAVVDEMSKVHLGGSSGSEAVRQARQNAGNMAEKPNEVELKDYDKK